MFLPSATHVPCPCDAGVSELQGITAAITMTMALARESVGGTLPRQLMSMLSPFR